MVEQPEKQSPKKRQLKKVETVRQRSERLSTAKPKARRVRRSAGVVGKPFRTVGRGLARILHPFAFLLVPFKTKPARKIGRFLAAVLLLKFIREAWAELRQVQWPSARETTRLTIAVFVFSLIFGVIVAVTDYGLDKVFRKVFIE